MDTVLTDRQREMVLANVALVEHIVNRVGANLPAIHSRDDLVQTGILGLIAATIRYDPAQGTAFSTYAGRRIEGAIIDMLRQADWAPRSVRALERRMSQANAAGADSGRANVEGLSKQLGLSPADLDRVRADIDKARIDSLDRPVNNDGAPTPLSATVFDKTSLVEDALDDQEMVGYLRDGVAALPDRHRMVIVGYFFEGRSMTELGTLLGVTQSRASQIKDEALKMLGKGLTEVYRDTDAADTSNPGDGPTNGRQQDFNESMAHYRPWRDRLDAGKGISVTG